jgi:hypothetical protein
MLFWKKIGNVWDEFIRTPALVKLAYLLLICATLLGVWFLYFGGYFFGDFVKPDPEKAKEIQPFISGLVVPLLTLGSTLLVIANLRSNNLQNFNNNLFKLIDQHHRLVDNINTHIGENKESSKGSEFFDDLAERISNVFDELSQSDSESNSISFDHNVESRNLHEKEPNQEEYNIDSELRDTAKGKSGKELLVVIYDHFFHLYQSDLSHCIRNLYYIVRFIDNASISRATKEESIKILRSQLSNYELLIVAYNGLHEYGAEFYNLIEKHHFLKSLNSERRVPIGYKKKIIDLKILTTAYPHLNMYWNAGTSSK